MNKWTRKTLRLAAKSDYLDRLYKIYPVETKKRAIDRQVLQSVRTLYQSKNKQGLISCLLKLEKFPYKDSYTASLRLDPSALTRNPKTVDRIYNTLVAMGESGVMAGITKEKESNTRRGPDFRKWLKKTFTHVDERNFIKNKHGIVCLDASESDMKDFCNTTLNAGISKKPDLLAKSNKYYVMGEAKFLSSAGGNQDRGFEDAASIANKANAQTHAVALIDGYLWSMKSTSKRRHYLDTSSLNIFSALLLKDFLKSVGK